MQVKTGNFVSTLKEFVGWKKITNMQKNMRCVRKMNVLCTLLVLHRRRDIKFGGQLCDIVS